MMTLWNDPTTVAVLEIAVVVAIAIAIEMLVIEVVAVNVVLTTVTAVASVNRVVIVTNHVAIATVKIVTWWCAMMPVTKSSIEMAICCALVLSAGLMASGEEKTQKIEIK